MRWGPALVAFAAMCAVLPGCTKPQESADVLSLLIPQDCYGSTPFCHATAGEYRIEALHLADESHTEIGIHITSMDRDVMIVNSTLAGFSTGIKLDGIRCKQCHVRLDNVSITGPSAAPGEYGIYIYADERLGVTGSSLQNVTISGYRMAMASYSEHGLGASFADVDIACVERGVRVTRGPIDLRRVHVVGCRGVALQFTGASEVRATGLDLRDNDEGLVTEGTATLSASRFIDNRVGGVFSYSGTLDIDSSFFGGNGISLDDASPFVPTTLLHAVASGGGSIEVRASCFVGDPGWGVATLAVTDDAGTLEGNWWGSPLGPRRGTLAVATDAVLVGVGDPAADIVSLGFSDAKPATAPVAACGLATTT